MVMKVTKACNLGVSDKHYPVGTELICLYPIVTGPNAGTTIVLDAEGRDGVVPSACIEPFRRIPKY